MQSDLDDLYSEIGNSLVKPGLGARKPSRAEAVESGRSWLASHKEQICKAITDEKVQKLLKGSGSLHEEQIRTLGDIIAAYVLGVPPGLIARAILILGEHWFCGGSKV